MSISKLICKNVTSNNNNNNIHRQNIIRAYFRNDDTFTLFRGIRKQVEIMVNCLNIINKHIQFTLENTNK